MSDTIEIFISYSHSDKGYLRDNSLFGYIKGLEKDNNIKFWTDHKIRPGEVWDPEIKSRIKRSDIALVLVSQHFLDSYYCQNEEIKNFLAHKVHLFPIILSACNWKHHDWLRDRLFLPGGDETLEENYQNQGKRKRLYSTIREKLLEQIKLTRKERLPRSGLLSTQVTLPYPGLRPFNIADASMFFGREEEIEMLIERIKNLSQRFLAVIGASGSGKSSLVSAGLINQLTESDSWLYTSLTPSEVDNNPFKSLATSLKPELQNEGYKIPDIESTIKTGKIDSLVNIILKNQPRKTKFLIFIDQFEELFTLVDEKHRKPFATLLGKMTKIQGLRTIITLRADFYENCLNYPPLNKLLCSGSFPISTPDPVNMMRMITDPATRANLIFEGGLPRQIFQDTGNSPGALALMAFALSELYDACKVDKQLTFNAYNEIGCVSGAISKRAEDTYKKLDPEVQEAMSEVFTELVEIIDPVQSTPVRKRVSLVQFDSSLTARLFIKEFIEVRLLVIYDDEEKNEIVLEVSHDLLLKQWPRLKYWINERLDDLHLRRQLQHAALDWKFREYTKSYLWSNERVIEVSRMLARSGYQPNTLESKFLGPINTTSMLKELENHATSPQSRALIGTRLALLGDPRPGVGLQENGLPDIVWKRVPKGHVILNNNVGTSNVELFYMSCYPITNKQFQAFIDDPNGYLNTKWWIGLDGNPGTLELTYRNEDNFPRETVSWYESMAFCAWISNKLNLDIRLPTEFQWQQAACSNNTMFKYPWGPRYKSGYANVDENWDHGNSNNQEYLYNLGRTSSVGLYPHGNSLQGISDLSGNVWEWCLNEYDKPLSISISGQATRAVRGGSWYDNKDLAQSSFRLYYEPDTRYPLSFRLCTLDLTTKSVLKSQK